MAATVPNSCAVVLNDKRGLRIRRGRQRSDDKETLTAIPRYVRAETQSNALTEHEIRGKPFLLLGLLFSEPV